MEERKERTEKDMIKHYPMQHSLCQQVTRGAGQELLEHSELDGMGPVLPWSLLRHSILLQQRNDLRIEELVWFQHLDWYREGLLGPVL